MEQQVCSWSSPAPIGRLSCYLSLIVVSYQAELASEIIWPVHLNCQKDCSTTWPHRFCLWQTSSVCLSQTSCWPAFLWNTFKHSTKQQATTVWWSLITVVSPLSRQGLRLGVAQNTDKAACFNATILGSCRLLPSLTWVNGHSVKT